jgi:hypothetical protein
MYLKEIPPVGSVVEYSLLKIRGTVVEDRSGLDSTQIKAVWVYIKNGQPYSGITRPLSCSIDCLTLVSLPIVEEEILWE